MLSQNTKSLETLARLTILEGMLGLAPGSLVGRGDQHALTKGMQRAQGDVLPVNPEWFRIEDGSILNAIRRGLPSDTSPEDVEDALMSILSGLSRSQRVEGGQLYSLGQAVGHGARMSDVAHWMGRHAAHRAPRPRAPIDVFAFQAKTSEDSEAARFDRAGQNRRWMITALEAAWAKSPGKLAVAKVWLADPGLSATDVARKMGHGEHDPVPWVKEGIASYVASIIRQVPGVLQGRMPAEVTRYLVDGI